MNERARRVRIRSVLLLAVAAGLLVAAVPAVGAIAQVIRPTKHHPKTVPAASAPARATTPARPVPTAPARIVPTTPARPAPTSASIGVLAANSSVQSHGCSAAVVASESGDVVVTAAHCVSGSGAGLVFAPGYRQGTAALGTWDVQAAYVDPAWISQQDPHHDVAFLVVRPSASNANPQPVQDVVGGFALGTAPAASTAVWVTGYVSGAADPVVCTAPVYLTSGYPSFDCAGFAAGTSGGPWIVTSADGTARIAGVIGGLHQGGCVVSTSYSAPFTAATAAVLARADAQAAPDLLPDPSGDGC